MPGSARPTRAITTAYVSTGRARPRVRRPRSATISAATSDTKARAAARPSAHCTGSFTSRPEMNHRPFVLARTQPATSPALSATPIHASCRDGRTSTYAPHTNWSIATPTNARAAWGWSACAPMAAACTKPALKEAEPAMSSGRGRRAFVGDGGAAGSSGTSGGASRVAVTEFLVCRVSRGYVDRASLEIANERNGNAVSGSGRGELLGLLAVVVDAQVALGGGVVRRVERAAGFRRLVRSAPVGSARMEPKGLAGTHLDRHPVERLGEVGANAAVGVDRQQLVVEIGDDLEAAVAERGVVDGDHARDVGGHEPVGGRVLVRGIPRAARELVVDLLLVEHRRFAEQRGRRRDHGSAREQRAQALVEGHEVVGPAQLRSVVGHLPVVQPLARVIGP